MKRFARSIPGKMILFILCAALLCVTVVCFFSSFYFSHEHFYDVSKETNTNEKIDTLMSAEAERIARIIAEEKESITEYPYVVHTGTNFQFLLHDHMSGMVAKSEGVWGTENWTHTYYFFIAHTQNELIFFPMNIMPSDRRGIYTMEARLEPGLPVNDEYRMTMIQADIGYLMRYAIYPIGGAALLLLILCFIWLMCVSARRPNSDGLFPGALNFVPFDLLVFLNVGISVALFFGVKLLKGMGFNIFAVEIWGMLGWIIVVSCLLIGLCMSAAARIKQKNLMENTLIGHFGSIWRAAILAGVLTLAELAVIWCVNSFGMKEYWLIWVFWIVEKFLVIFLIGYGMTMFLRLKKGGEALANGNFSAQIDVKGMAGEYKEHADALNSVGEVINVAVEERIKSERMKTELITNVSHDLKTPLTSIINYSGLIHEEPCENPRITEYSGVLLRQSERLKRLIEDLVEASKAATGNLEVELVPCEAGVMLTQVAGEYEQRLCDAGLELVTRQPDHPVYILADGRRLWRVFDNLLGNVCKYALERTRVYLTLEEIGGMAVISLKNISREALDLTPDELLERFVRGDASRSTEGNGLGLSIANSLTKLQNGELELAVDGDLFKATLKFPVIEE